MTLVDRKDEIGDLGRHFGRMAARIETTLFSQQRLLRDVSHELNAPLARLQIAVGLARQRSEGLVDPELDRIEQEAERLNDLIRQTLALARLSNQTLLTHKSHIELSELLNDVIDNAEYEAQNKNCHVVLSVTDYCSIEGDWDLLHSGIENILRNAVHYTSDNTSVDVSLQKVMIANQPTIIIKIRDHGTGVPEEDIKHLFTPFFRVDKARTQQTGGYGIGLAIAERAIFLHNGKIIVNNILGNGLEITLQLPIEK